MHVPSVLFRSKQKHKQKRQAKVILKVFSCVSLHILLNNFGYTVYYRAGQILGAGWPKQLEIPCWLLTFWVVYKCFNICVSQVGSCSGLTGSLLLSKSLKHEVLCLIVIGQREVTTAVSILFCQEQQLSPFWAGTHM